MAQLSRMNCHIGQRKLSLALVEFMTLARVRCGSDSMFVVYPGASIMACLAATHLFPGARFLCFDPSYASTVQNVLRELGDHAQMSMRKVSVIRERVAIADAAVKAFETGSTIAVFTDDSGLYGDASHTLALDVQRRVAKDSELLFVSDVRMSGPDGKEPGELQIAEDMAAQARWLKDIGARCWVVKMRLPFLNAAGALDPAVAAVYAKLGGTSTAGKAHEVPYLQGTPYVQLYGRTTTTELRLVGLDGFAMQTYDLRPVEQIMAAFNTVHRSHTRFTSAESVRGPGFDELVDETLSPEARKGTYDAVAEASILRDALATRLSAPPSTDALRAVFAEFSALFAQGRHPRTCAPQSGKHGGGTDTNRALGVFGVALVGVTVLMAFMRC